MTAEKIILKYQEKARKVSLMMMREKNYRLTKMILLPI